MNIDTSLFGYFLNASLVVKIVMLILASASIFSWGYIFQRLAYLKQVNRATAQFEHRFWGGEDLSKLYGNRDRGRASLEGMEAIFYAGFKEFLRFKRQAHASLESIIDNARRAMRVSQMREQDKLEKNLQFLAIVGSTCPYIGIFGTVWGIMQAFGALSKVQQVTIAMVAPGISEALIATALGLFAAIPAVVAYNRFVNEINRLMNRNEAFQEEFTNILIRQSQQQVHDSKLEAMETL